MKKKLTARTENFQTVKRTKFLPLQSWGVILNVTYASKETNIKLLADFLLKNNMLTQVMLKLTMYKRNKKKLPQHGDINKRFGHDNDLHQCKESKKMEEHWKYAYKKQK